MEQYISKSALLAEIERLKNTSLEYGYNTMQKVLANSGKDISLRQLQNFIDDLEVKEVDLDGERRKYLTEHFNVYEDGILQSKRSNLPLDTYDVIKIAKHFFELGMQVSNKA